MDDEFDDVEKPEESADTEDDDDMSLPDDDELDKDDDELSPKNLGAQGFGIDDEYEPETY